MHILHDKPRPQGDALTRTVACTLALVAGCGTVAAQGDEAVHTTPASMLIGYEQVHLPGGERMGLVGAQYLFEPWQGWRLGPAAYGAATGQRGGLFTWGGELQYVGRPSSWWQWSAGLYAGGGGGAAAPVGGGLMLRPHVDLWWRQTGWQIGLSASHVKFPSGTIGSSQLGLVLAFDDTFAFTAPDRVGSRVDWSGRGGIGFDRVQAVVGDYRFRRGTSGSMGHVGIRLDRRIGSPNAWGLQTTAGLEAAGAAHGGADGYAEALGTLGVELPLGGLFNGFFSGATVGLRGALGLAGGGAVPTRGGTIAKVAATATVPIGQQWFVGGEVGHMRALQGSVAANYAQLGLGFWLDQVGRPGAAGARGSDVGGASDSVTGMRWGLALERYGSARRKDGTTRPMETVGLRFDRALGSTFYLTGQAHTAVSGGAGAYSTGLFGLGAALPLTPGWRVGAELLAGAAGGGGVAVQGGAVAQPMVWAVRDLGTYNQLHLGAGRLRSFKGDLSTPVVEVSWTVAFGVPERR